jgi:hypothetical protein
MISAGSVSTGTLRTQDLVPRFFEVLHQVSPALYQEVAGEHLGVLQKLLVTSGQWVTDDHPAWDEEATSDLLEALFDALNEKASQYDLTFSAHPGDGANFGFWSQDA